MYKGVTTSELDELAAETAANLSSIHPDYAVLAARISVSNLHKNTKKNFVEVMNDLYTYVEPRTGLPAPLIAPDVHKIIQENADELNAAIVYNRDYTYDYFGFKTLERSYLLKLHGQIVERPQHMLMRVSVGIHKSDIKSAIETYNLMSQKWFTHASPTLFNAGTCRPQLSSCFLVTMKDDSIEGIYDTLKTCAQISKQAGGVGLAVHNIRATGSYIRGTNGTSNGLVPMLRVFNNTARYVDQCFGPETIVYTAAGPKPIASLEAGVDRVLTHTGTYQLVDQLVAHEVKEGELSMAVSIQQSLAPVRVTDAHQVLAVTGHAVDVDAEVMMHRLSKGAAQRQMVDANELKVGDFLCFPVPSAETQTDIADLTVEDCRALGRLVATTRGSSSSSSSETTLALPSGFQLSASDLADEQGNAHVHARFQNLPKAKLLAIVRGIIDAAQATSSSEAVNGFVVEVASRQVTESLRWMLLRCGILTSSASTTSTDKDNTTALNLGPIVIPRVSGLVEKEEETVQTTSYLQHEGWLYSRIESIEQLTSAVALTTSSAPAMKPCEGVASECKTEGKEATSSETPLSLAQQVHQKKMEELRADGSSTTTVYDLEVAQDHTYVTSMGTVHNGGGKRKGAFAIYLEPWHSDIMAFLDLRKNHGVEENRARDLFYGLWVPDLFMKRVENNELWSLFCPNEAPGLAESWGPAFEALYTKYENQGKARSTIKARALWAAVLDSQQETGTPYILYKDACNAKSNQQNLGTIRCSNLCTEIVEYTAPDEVAVCNLASIALNRFVDEAKGVFDFKRLYEVTQVVTKNLNKVIDINHYPVKEAEYSNLRHRPIGLGVQGLADAFILLRLPYESEEAQKLNQQIFETIYFAALSASADLAERDGPYTTFQGSPASKGLLQFDLWNVTPSSGLWDWAALKARIARVGLRNSLLVAPMPTASTSQILGNNESFEPYTSNLYVRRTMAGEFICVNSHLLRDLIKLGIWSETLKNKLIAHNGSVQDLTEIPEKFREIYKTVWEMKGKTLVNMAADRGAYIDQSQSFNVHMTNVNFAKLTSMHFYAWKKGLKTGMYYLRTKAAADAIKFTVDPAVVKQQAGATVSASVSTSASAPATVTSPPPAIPLPLASAINAASASSSASGLSAPSPLKSTHLLTKTPTKKQERDSEEAESLATWRAERERQRKEVMCALDNKEGCISCGS